MLLLFLSVFFSSFFITTVAVNRAGPAKEAVGSRQTTRALPENARAAEIFERRNEMRRVRQNPTGCRRL